MMYRPNGMLRKPGDNSLRVRPICGWLDSSPQMFIEAIYPGVRLRRTVLGNVIPYLANIGAGERPTNNASHWITLRRARCVGAGRVHRA